MISYFQHVKIFNDDSLHYVLTSTISCINKDVVKEIVAELHGYPDFIIGNYSDGNLVACLLAAKMGVTRVMFFLLFPLTLPWKCRSHVIFN